MRAFAPPPNKATAFASSAFSADGKEEIRPEYKKMMSDFNELYSLVHPMIMKHYAESATADLQNPSQEKDDAVYKKGPEWPFNFLHEFVKIIEVYLCTVFRYKNIHI